MKTVTRKEMTTEITLTGKWVRHNNYSDSLHIEYNGELKKYSGCGYNKLNEALRYFFNAQVSYIIDYKNKREFTLTIKRSDLNRSIKGVNKRSYINRLNNNIKSLNNKLDNYYKHTGNLTKEISLSHISIMDLDANDLEQIRIVNFYKWHNITHYRNIYKLINKTMEDIKLNRFKKLNKKDIIDGLDCDKFKKAMYNKLNKTNLIKQLTK